MCEAGDSQQNINKNAILPHSACRLPVVHAGVITYPHTCLANHVIQKRTYQTRN